MDEWTRMSKDYQSGLDYSYIYKNIMEIRK